MPAVKKIEEILGDFYRQADELIGVLSVIDIPIDDSYTRNQIKEFVVAVRRSFDIAKTRGYATAWEALQTASAGFIGLCKYKDKKFPNVNEDLSRKCAEAYRTLPEPGDAPKSLDASLLDESNVKRMERAYKGITGEPKPTLPGQPTSVISLTQEQFEALEVGTPILIRNKFGGDPNWYTAEVTRGILTESIASNIHFKFTGAGKGDAEFSYYFSDAEHVAYQRSPGAQ